MPLPSSETSMVMTSFERPMETRTVLGWACFAAFTSCSRTSSNKRRSWMPTARASTATSVCWARTGTFPFTGSGCSEGCVPRRVHEGRRSYGGSVNRTSRDGSSARPEPPRPVLRPSRAARALGLLGGTLALLYGGLSLFIALVFGPDSTHNAVSGGVELVPWYGLSAVGTLAAVGALVMNERPRQARWAILLAFVSLAGWTVLFAGSN